MWFTNMKVPAEHIVLKKQLGYIHNTSTIFENRIKTHVYCNVSDQPKQNV